MALKGRTWNASCFGRNCKTIIMCTVMSLESSLISLKVMSGCFDFQFAIGSLMDDYLGKCCFLFLEPHRNNLCCYGINDGVGKKCLHVAKILSQMLLLWSRKPTDIYHLPFLQVLSVDKAEHFSQFSLPLELLFSTRETSINQSRFWVNLSDLSNKRSSKCLWIPHCT